MFNFVDPARIVNGSAWSAAAVPICRVHPLGHLCNDPRDRAHPRYSPIAPLTYVINFRDSSNCSRIQRVQPGEEIQVLVRPEQEPFADLLGAKGTRSQDGALFIVELTTADGKPQSFEWEYPMLKLVSQLLQPLP